MRFLLFLLALSLVHGLSLAQGRFPDKPVTLIVPYAAGGPMDKLARELVEPMRRELGQALIIQNSPGAGGNIGTGVVSRAAADGYTVLMNHIGIATAPSLYRRLAFSPENFETVGVFAESPMMLVVRPQVPNASVVQFVRWIAKQPQVTLGNAGIGSASHLCGLLFQQSIKTAMTTIPYKGTGPALTDLLGGNIDMMCDLTANVTPSVTAGKIAAVGVTSEKRLVGTPLAKYPTLGEFGLSGMKVTIWYGLYVPKGTPAGVVARLNAAMKAGAADASFRRAQNESGIEVVTDVRSTPAGHSKFLIQEIQRWSPVIKAGGAYID
jgi:tripartite-type tricarboxylate transporter receptor subunit TctC